MADSSKSKAMQIRSTAMLAAELDAQAKSPQASSGMEAFAVSDDDHIKCGYLTKKGAFNKGWKRRYFVLSPRWLKYYESEGQKKAPKGQIQLRFVKEVRPTAKATAAGQFDVVTPTRTYKVSASNGQEMSEWIEAIQRAVKGESRRQDSIKLQTKGKKVKAPPPPDLANWEHWKGDDIMAWLYTFGLQKYADNFIRAGITGSMLKSFSTSQLQHVCGVERVQDQIKILEEVKLLVKHNLAFGTPMPDATMMGGEDDIQW